MDPEVLKERMHTADVMKNIDFLTFVGLFLVALTAFCWWLYNKRYPRRCILLTGLSDSGKTLIYVRLAYTQYRQTFTSMCENTEEYLTPALPHSMLLVDLPGQERLRNKFFDQYKNKAKGIVFVVDSVTIQKEIRDAAEYLYTILADPIVQLYNPPLLILCNKQDQPLAKGSQVIKGLLEKEINLVRVTKSNQLKSVDPAETNTAVFLGKQGKDFQFSHLNCKVDVAECSANTGNERDYADLKMLKEWIDCL
ncbi:signal recognition particle receptor subunit beta [Ostrinia nubilalis]|uniref:signal recognition particle receptor subunit beta n=1 Tax=Ostrinia furnacalis TaxID=93504 RepID=UPI00103F3180|nr:signal recognition particle receptor subunit beta [Ostrinia furnacalis]